LLLFRGVYRGKRTTSDPGGDGIIWLTLEEMGLEGPAEIVSIEACPPIATGPGRVVLSTVTHFNAFVLEITLEGLDDPPEPTRTHRIYSETAGGWVAAGDLEVGDRLRTSTGSVAILDIQPKPGIHRVYNIEVETGYRYYVGDLEVLSHNNCAHTPKPKETPHHRKGMRKSPKEPRAEKTPRPSSSKMRRDWEKYHGKRWPKEPSGRNYDGHHIIPQADEGESSFK
jgi:hypothetical protein